MVIFNSYVKLPEGIQCYPALEFAALRPFLEARGGENYSKHFTDQIEVPHAEMQGPPSVTYWYLIIFGHMAMDQYLLIPFLGGWTSIYQLFWGSLGTRVLTHPHLIILDHIWQLLHRFGHFKRSKWGDGCRWSSRHRSTGGLALGSGTAGGASEPGTVLRNPLSVPWRWDWPWWTMVNHGEPPLCLANVWLKKKEWWREVKGGFLSCRIHFVSDTVMFRTGRMVRLQPQQGMAITLTPFPAAIWRPSATAGPRTSNTALAGRSSLNSWSRCGRREGGPKIMAMGYNIWDIIWDTLCWTNIAMENHHV